MNYVKTFGLMALLSAMFVAVAGTLVGRGAMLPAFGFAAVFNFGSYWFSDRVVLRMYKARAPHLCIVNPLRGGGRMARLFRTHPPTEERVKRLEAMAHGHA
jgi:Zn-dependent protease with chaperone function